MKKDTTITKFLDVMMMFQIFLKEKSHSSFNIVEMSTLAFIWKNKKSELSLKKIAQFMGITNASTSVFIKKMEKKGFVKRKSNIRDKRSFSFSITKKGIKYITETQKKVKEELIDFFKVLNKKECNNLDLILEKIINSKQEKK